MHHAKTAAIVRKDMLTGKYSFSGSFESDCQAKSVPVSVLSLVKMILYGPNIEEQGPFPERGINSTRYNNYSRDKSAIQGITIPGIKMGSRKHCLSLE